MIDDKLPEPSCGLKGIVITEGRHVCKYRKQCDYKEIGHKGTDYCGYLEQLRIQTQLSLIGYDNVME